MIGRCFKMIYMDNLDTTLNFLVQTCIDKITVMGYDEAQNDIEMYRKVYHDLLYYYVLYIDVDEAVKNNYDNKLIAYKD